MSTISRVSSALLVVVKVVGQIAEAVVEGVVDTILVFGLVNSSPALSTGPCPMVWHPPFTTRPNLEVG